jgi:hypothetical protein
VSPSSNPDFRPRDVIMVFVLIPLVFILAAVLVGGAQPLIRGITELLTGHPAG